MSVHPKYLGKFNHRNGDSVTFLTDPDPMYVQFYYLTPRYTHRMPLKDWMPQVDDGRWVAEIPEFMRLSDGL